MYLLTYQKHRAIWLQSPIFKEKFRTIKQLNKKYNFLKKYSINYWFKIYKYVYSVPVPIKYIPNIFLYE